eukprot:scaffold12319_cov49-Attheya_sp.AAC.1
MAIGSQIYLQLLWTLGPLMVWSQDGTDLFLEVGDVSQPWYADDAGTGGGTFNRIKLYFEKLEECGPKYDYFPKASKSILIVREHNVERAKEYSEEMNFTIISGYQYLGGSVGAQAEMKEWIGEKADEWTA